MNAPGIDTVAERIAGEFGAFDLSPHLLALGAVGSISHGTHGEVIDDVDYMGIVVPPVRHIIGLGQWEHWVYKQDEWDVVLYSAHKMVSLLLKSNPNVLGFLWLPDHLYAARSPFLDVLIANRDAFSSLRAYHTFSGYAHSQLSKMHRFEYNGYMGAKRKELVQQFGYDTKNAAHLIRLLRMGCEFLETGQMNIWRDDRDELRRIKRGEVPYNWIMAESNALFERAKASRDASALPPEPDFDTAERLLMDLHRERAA
jgi:predicted nucleotidyltransferase